MPLSRGWAPAMATSRCRTKPAGRRKPLAAAGRSTSCLLDQHCGGSKRRAHQRKPGAVEHDTLAGLEHDVVRVAVLDDPQLAGETAHGETPAVANVEHLAGAQVTRDGIEAGGHAESPLA